MDYKIGVMICYRDRPTEIALLLQSLRTQTYKNFRIFIVDDASSTPIQNYHFLMCLMNKLNDEGNYVTYVKNDFNLGVSKSRQKCAEMAINSNYPDLLCRVDDDVILEPNYLEKLLKVIENGYDLATGVTPFIGQPQLKRESRFIKPIGNKVILNNKGEFIFNGDDFGMQYLDEEIIPIHHFRSCALYKKEIHEKVSYDSRLTKHGFREEEILSFKMIINGFKLGVITSAIAWHLMTPSGGERFADSNELIKINEEVLSDFVKDKYKELGNFLEDYNRKLGIVNKFSEEEIIKSTNCMIK